MAFPKMSIGICTKNSENTIGRTLNSVLDQDYDLTSIELIIVDGLSTDNTVKIIYKKLNGKNIKYRILNDGGKGLGYARQMVIEEAESEYIIWLDSDVVLLSNFLEEMYNYILKKPKVGICRASSKYIKNKDIISDIHNLLFSSLDIIYFGATITRKRVLEKIGGFDVNIRGAAEDVDIKKRMMQAGWKYEVNNNAYFYHMPKETIKNIFRQYNWYGHGDYFLFTKYRDIIRLIYMMPAAYFIWLLKIAKKSHSKFRRKRSYLIPLFGVFINFSWWTGFFSAYLDKYEHKM